MVKSLLSLLSARQNSILSGAAVLMLTVFAAKLLGLIKDRLLVHNFNTADASVFFAASNLPDLLFQLLVLGTLSVAFIPIFTDHLHKNGERDAFEFASNILNLSLLTFIVLALVSFVFVSPINSLLVPGFSGRQKELTDQLTRVLLFSQVFLVIGSFFIGVAQSYQRCIIPSLGPLFYNLGIILGIVFFSGFGLIGPVVGVLIGSVLHVLIQFPLIKSLGFQYKLSFDLFNLGVREVFKLMSLRNISLVVEQLNERVGFALASTISSASPAVLTFSNHLFAAPIGLFGSTIAQAALPVLSREQAKGEVQSFKVTLLTTMHQILFLTLPAAAILIVLRIPVVRLVFGAQQFSWDDTVLTGRTVALFALGLTAQSVIMLLVRGFYALKDTRTPVSVSVFTVLLNIALSALFVSVLKLDVWSLGLAYSITTNLALALLIYLLNRKVGGFDLRSLLEPAMKMLVAAATAAVALYIPVKALDQLVFDTTRTANLIVLTAIASIFGLGIYILLVWLMEVKELGTFTELLKRLARLQKNVKSQEIIPETEAV